MGLQLYPRRVYERILKDPLVDPDAFHPALLNAVALVACSCGGERMQRFEDVFLARTRDFCAEALSFAQQLDDFMAASALQCAYIARSGRIREGYTLGSSAYNSFSPVRHLTRILIHSTDAMRCHAQRSAASHAHLSSNARAILQRCLPARLTCWGEPGMPFT